MSRTRALAGVLATLTFAVSACGGDPDAPEAAPSPADPPSSGSPSASATPSTSPTATVAPASGRLVETSRFSFRAPRGFTYREVSGEFLGSLSDLVADDHIYFGVTEDYPETSLGEQAQEYVEGRSFDRAPRQVADAELDGREVFHLSGPVSDRNHLEVYGRSEDGVAVDVTFDIHSEAQRREEIIASVLATWRWED